MHHSVSAESVSEEKNVAVPTCGYGQGGELVEKDELSGAVRQRLRDAWPANGIKRSFTHLTLEAPAYPRPRARFNTDPPVATFQYLESSSRD